MPGQFEELILRLISARRGHFLLESGHHGDLWFGLELLCARPRILSAVVHELARRLQEFDIEMVCGPLIEGAFIALEVGSELDIGFCYAERFSRPIETGLFPAAYRIPPPLRPLVRRKRVAIVNDVINAGSAVRATFEDLTACDAQVPVIAALLTLGTHIEEFAAAKGVRLESLATLPNTVWTPSMCPLCAEAVPLEDVADFSSAFTRHPLQ